METVFPARAGVILSRWVPGGADPGLSRASGGDPNGIQWIQDLELFFPRERGGIPHDSTRSCRICSSSRASGGDPSKAERKSATEESFPRERG